jgi:hypothetical protein
VTAHDVVLSVDGEYSSIASAFARWKKAHLHPEGKDEALERVRLDSGQLAWIRPFGEQTRLEIENASGVVERSEGRPLGDDYQMVAPLFDVVDTAGKAGPWQLKVETENRVTRATVAFDPSGSSRAQALVTVNDAGIASVLVTVPRTPLSQLGLDSGFLGVHQDQPLFVEGEAQYAVSAAGRVQGHVRMTATGARVNGSLTPSQADLELRIDGDPKAPVELADGIVAVGPFRGRPTGSVTFGDGFVRVDLAWKGGSTRCVGGGEQSLATTAHFDSHDLDGSKWTVGGTRCSRAP